MTITPALHKQKLIEQVQMLARLQTSVIVESSRFTEKLSDPLPPEPVLMFVGLIKDHYDDRHLSWCVWNEESCFVFTSQHLGNVRMLMGSLTAKAIITLV